MLGHINLNVEISDFYNLKYNKATIDEKYLKEYLDSGHSEEQMIIYNYFEPNPMPDCVYKIKENFSNLKPISVAVNFLKPGQYLPLHKDLYKKWMSIHGVKDIHRVFRAIVMLEDSSPGQILQIEQNLYTNWKAGDWFSWNGEECHAIYNLSLKNRFAVQVTGIRVDNNFKIC